MTIKAIETEYKGYRFRSRLEARWAVFFDALGIEWEYEKEGFSLPEGYYLPDFWIPRWKLWVEIKPRYYQDEAAPRKCLSLALETGNATLLVEGNPHPGEYEISGYIPDKAFPGVVGGAFDYGTWQEGQIRGWGYGLWVGCTHERTACECGFYPLDISSTPVLAQALNTARAARFEHGEKPMGVTR